jgi:hypothetical protein
VLIGEQQKIVFMCEKQTLVSDSRIASGAGALFREKRGDLTIASR